jgi:hypothetical protein
MRDIRVILLAVVASVGCVAPATRAVRGAIPDPVRSSLTFLSTNDSAYSAADPMGATGAPGEGRVVRAFVVRLEKDIRVYRLWSGPDVLDRSGHTSRLGSWWTFDRPTGSRDSYRRRYEVCEGWNTLTWVASCVLRKGAVVVIGFGQSVSENTCDNRERHESYPQNDRDLQVYIHNAFQRTSLEPPELLCPEQNQDYEDDRDDVSKPRTP